MCTHTLQHRNFVVQVPTVFMYPILVRVTVFRLQATAGLAIVSLLSYPSRLRNLDILQRIRLLSRVDVVALSPLDVHRSRVGRSRDAAFPDVLSVEGVVDTNTLFAFSRRKEAETGQARVGEAPRNLDQGGPR